MENSDEKQRRMLYNFFMDHAEDILIARRRKLHQKKMHELRAFAHPKTDYADKNFYIEDSIQRDIKYFDN